MALDGIRKVLTISTAIDRRDVRRSVRRAKRPELIALRDEVASGVQELRDMPARDIKTWMLKRSQDILDMIREELRGDPEIEG